MRIPDRDTTRIFFGYYLSLSVVFLIVYGGVNYLTSIRSDLHILYFDWELNTVFVPGFIYIYLSVFLVFLLPLFSLNARQIRAIAAAFVMATVVAGIVYLLLPAQLPFVRPDSVPGHEFAFKCLYALALPHNLFPSLHVTYSVLFIGVICGVEKSVPLKANLLVWLALLLVSVLLVRQHQIIDIAGGIVLAAISYSTIYRPMTH